MASYRVHAEQSVKLARAELIEESTLSVLRDTFSLLSVPKKHKEHALGLAYLRSAYWYLLCAQSSTAQERLKRARSHYPFFLYDLRWLGLQACTRFPILNRTLDMEGLHDRV